uniref:Cadherin domain-containing protein n=1 Tax=Neogobius melanostomus TaxID=47308 RepID=A0A8C6UEY4_9GOBI
MPPLNSTAFVMVSVTDCNDNAPKFSNTEYHVQVSENSHIGTSLVQVHAHDPDFGINGLVRYDIVSGDGKGHLKLDPQSGVLVVNQSLDYEEFTKYTVTVRAFDGSETSDQRKVAFAVIYVTVLDENDNTPYFMFPTVNYTATPLSQEHWTNPHCNDPTFSPSLTSLSMRTPNASPVVSDTGVEASGLRQALRQ